MVAVIIMTEKHVIQCHVYLTYSSNDEIFTLLSGYSKSHLKLPVLGVFQYNVSVL